MSPSDHGESNTVNREGPRNERFGSNQPFDSNPSLSLLGATGTFRYFNPTSAQYSWSGWNSSHGDPSSHDFSSTADQRHTTKSPSSPEEQEHRSSEEEGEPEGHLPARRKDDTLSFVWRSRDNRKGRHALLLRRGEDGRQEPHGTLEPTNSLPATIRGIIALFTRFPYWDISWCVAIVYVVGSIVWVANGFTGVLPLAGKGSSEALTSANTWTAFSGGSVFLLGSYLLFLEAVNANRTGCFGWAVERTLTGPRLDAKVHPDGCEHHYHEREKDTGGKEESHYSEDVERRPLLAQQDSNRRDTQDATTPDPHYAHDWLWWPSWREFRTHLMYEIGFLACAVQLVSGCLFWLCKFTTLPGITERISQPVMDGTNWAPQIVGCVGFIAASLAFMLETQQRWYLPAPNVLGWHVGFWKLVGCVGFLLSAIFGLLGQHGSDWAQAQSTISSFWGSWMILIGSIIQWYESLDKYPIIQEGTSRYSEWNEDFIEGSEERRKERGDEVENSHN